jgi:CheY-like chemotaxis protein
MRKTMTEADPVAGRERGNDLFYPAAINKAKTVLTENGYADTHSERPLRPNWPPDGTAGPRKVRPAKMAPVHYLDTSNDLRTGAFGQSKGRGPMDDRRALIVDDDPVFRFSSTLTLEMHGFEVWEASNGKDALVLIETAGKRRKDFHLFLVDLIMPVMDGMQLIGEIHKANMTDRVLVVSGSIDAQAMEELRSFGCHHWLAKPFLVSQLMDAVHQIQRPGA